MSGHKIRISICTFQNGSFDVMFRDVATGREITFTGQRKLNEEEFEFADEIAPACVWTEYERITPDD